MIIWCTLKNIDMRLFIFFLISVLFLTSCIQSAEQEYKPEFKPNSEAWIQVNAENVKDTLYLNARTYTTIPSDMIWAKEKIKATKPGSYFLNVLVDRPYGGELSINESVFKCFLLPGDTTVLNLSFRKGKPHLIFEGSTSPFNNYYQAKVKNLGYTSSNYQINTFREGKVDMALFKKQVLSLEKNEIHFLEQYIKENNLPEWFIENEIAQIQYLSAFWLLMLPEHNKSNNLPTTQLPQDYYNFLDEVKIDNDKALFSSTYFDFLYYYFMNGEKKESIESASGYHRTILSNSMLLPKAEKELSGQARTIYQHYLLTRLIKELPSTYPLDSLLAAYQIQDTSFIDYRKLLYQNTSTVKERKKLVKDDVAPNFFAVDSEDRLHELRQYKDKIVYLNFYATWCSPCIKNIPSRNRLYERMKTEKDFIMINVCLDSKIDKWQELINKHGMQGLNVYADGNWNKKIKDSYGIHGVPQYVLVSKENILVENYTYGADDIEKVVKELL